MSNKIQKKIWKVKIGSLAQKLLLIKIADYADSEGVCWPHISTLIQESEICRTTVFDHLKKFYSKNWIIKTVVLHSTGRTKGNSYRINIDQIVKDCSNPSLLKQSVKRTRLVRQTDSIVRQTDSIVRQTDPSKGNPHRTPKNICAHQDDAHEKFPEKLSEKFDAFWSRYPKKKGKDKSLKIWKSQKLDSKFDAIMKSLNEHILHEWKERESQFIPHPTSWLNQKMYNDEVLTATQKLNNSAPEEVHYSPEEFRARLRGKIL